MRIGELSRRSGRSVHAIRWYESIGLVPGVRRDAGMRRVYDQRHVGWLDLLARLRLSGMSTKQMRAYADLTVRGRATLDARRIMLAEHREHVLVMMSELRVSLALIERKIDFYSRWISTGRRPPEPIGRKARSMGKRKS